MKTALIFTASLFSLAWTQAASAGTVASLNDWCFNVNGDSADLCNTFPSSPVSLGSPVNGVPTSGNMDFTLSSSDVNYPTTAASNNLGSASFVLGPGSNYVNAYMDYDLNYDAVGGGSFQDFGSTNNSLPVGYSYEIDDPNSSAIFSDFAANTLGNTNNVGTYADSSNNNPCCDVSWALGVAVSVANGFEDTVTFNVTSDAASIPGGAFTLQQTNGIDTSQNIYLYATVTSQQVGPSSGTPEPGTFFLLGAGMIGLISWRIRAARTAA